MKNYRYNCVDKSILLPWLKKNLFAVLHRGIPYGVPANMLTLISIIIMWTTFFLFVNLEEVAGHDILLAVAAIFLYILFDHFDGLQAKATRSSSPLGEILDHFSSFGAVHKINAKLNHCFANGFDIDFIDGESAAVESKEFSDSCLLNLSC